MLSYNDMLKQFASEHIKKIADSLIFGEHEAREKAMREEQRKKQEEMKHLEVKKQLEALVPKLRDGMTMPEFSQVIIDRIKELDKGNCECANCGRKLFEAMLKASDNMQMPIASASLSEPRPMMSAVTYPAQSVQKFNAEFAELGTFVAWVVGVPYERLNRMHMVDYAAKKGKV